MHRTSIARRLLSPALVVSVLAGCAGGSKAVKQDVLFPPPPEKGRIRWVQSFRSEDDFKPSTMRSIWKALVPHEATGIQQPTSVALSPDEKTLYVAMPHQAKVFAIDLVGGGFKTIGKSGSDPVRRPVGVATDADGSLYVTDRDRGRVAVYSASGKLLRSFGSEKLVQPTGIAVDRKRQVAYVVNDAAASEGRHTVEVFSLAGKHLRTMGGGRSDEVGRFNFPRSVNVAATGDLYVADMLNFRVQVFDPNGQPVRSFGTLGSGFPGNFDKIQAVAFDGFGNVYVADAMQGIHIMNPVGAPLYLFGPGIIGQASGIAIDSKNRMYVSDLSHAIHIFELVNTTAADSYPTQPASSGAAPAAAPAPAKASSPPPGNTPVVE